MAVPWQCHGRPVPWQCHGQPVPWQGSSHGVDVAESRATRRIGVATAAPARGIGIGISIGSWLALGQIIALNFGHASNLVSLQFSIGCLYESSEKAQIGRAYRVRMKQEWGDRYCNSLQHICWDVFK